MARMTDVTTARARLADLAGRRKTIDVAALPGDLNVVSAPKQRLGHGSFSSTRQVIVLTPDIPVVVRQGRVKAADVAAYLDLLASGESVHQIAVTDRPGDGRLWHLDGVHRLVASRLIGLPVTAGLWR